MGVELRLEKRADHKVVVAHASGKLTKEDYELFLPEVERLIKEEGKIRLVFEMRDFHGWGPAGLWEDIKFDFKHFADIERLAMVGEKKWDEWMDKFCQPFIKAKTHYYDQSQEKDARDWIARD